MPEPTPQNQWAQSDIWRKIGLIGTVFGLFLSVSSAVAVIGFKVDRPVWLHEHSALKVTVYEFGAEYYNAQLNELYSRRTNLRLEKYKLEQARKPVPDFLIQELELLEIQIEEIKKKIEQAESQVENAA